MPTLQSGWPLAEGWERDARKGGGGNFYSMEITDATPLLRSRVKAIALRWLVMCIDLAHPARPGP